MIRYLVMAHRYGTNGYIFPVGLFDNREKAIAEAKLHRTIRGGKYAHKLYMLEEEMMYDAGDIRAEWITGGRK